MKFMKALSTILLLSILLTLTSLAAEPILVGKVINEAVYTDIIAYINDHPIRSFNINGNTAIIAEDLSFFGFNVVWNGSTRTLAVRDMTHPVNYPQNVQTYGKSMIGIKAFDVLYSDIITTVKGKLVLSFNINGSTAIYFDDLAEYGNIKWDANLRKITLNTSIVTQLKDSAGNIFYEGETRNGGPYGKGVLYLSGYSIHANFIDGFVDKDGATIYDSNNKLVYEGQLNTKREYEGTGKVYDEGILIYSGQLKGGKYNGYGEYYYTDGLIYKGNFIDDRCSGQGAMYSANHIMFISGTFSNDKLNGFCNVYDDYGNFYFEGYFVDDELTRVTKQSYNYEVNTLNTWKEKQMEEYNAFLKIDPLTTDWGKRAYDEAATYYEIKAGAKSSYSKTAGENAAKEEHKIRAAQMLNNINTTYNSQLADLKARHGV